MNTSWWQGLRRACGRSLALLVVGGASSGCVSAGEVLRPPFAQPFEVWRAEQSIEAEFDVREEVFYAFNLRFFYNPDQPQDRHRVWDLTGGNRRDAATGEWATPGAPLVLRLTVVSMTGGQPGAVVHDGDIRQPKETSIGSGVLVSRLQAIKLTPGRFKVTVRSLQESPSLSGVRTDFQVVRAYMGK